MVEGMGDNIVEGLKFLAIVIFLLAFGLGFLAGALIF